MQEYFGSAGPYSVGRLPLELLFMVWDPNPLLAEVYANNSPTKGFLSACPHSEDTVTAIPMRVLRRRRNAPSAAEYHRFPEIRL